MPGDMGAGNQELARFLVVLASNFPMGVTGFGDAIVMHIVLTLCSLVRTYIHITHRSIDRFDPSSQNANLRLHTQISELPGRLPERRVGGGLQPDHRRARGHGGAERAHLEGHELEGAGGRGRAWAIGRANARFVPIDHSSIHTGPTSNHHITPPHITPQKTPTTHTARPRPPPAHPARDGARPGAPLPHPLHVAQARAGPPLPQVGATSSVRPISLPHHSRPYPNLEPSMYTN